MSHRLPRSVTIKTHAARKRSVALLGAVVAMACALMLSGCNTAEGVGRDVSATGAALTRGANDLKNGL